jgi:hypothetical protein
MDDCSCLLCIRKPSPCAPDCFAVYCEHTEPSLDLNGAHTGHSSAALPLIVYHSTRVHLSRCSAAARCPDSL